MSSEAFPEMCEMSSRVASLAGCGIGGGGREEVSKREWTFNRLYRNK